MQITINGEAERFEDEGLTIARLLELKKVESPDMVSVQLNGEFVDRGRYQALTLADQDEVEFLSFMGGGAIR